MPLTIIPAAAGPLRQLRDNRSGDIPAHYPRPEQRFAASVPSTWEIVQGGGFIDPTTGVFHPPEDVHGKSTIRATSLDKSQTATATVTYHCPDRCTIHPVAG